MDRTDDVPDDIPDAAATAANVAGCLAAVHAVGLTALLGLDHPILAAEIRRTREQAKQEPYRYSAFASFVDLPPASERGRRDVAVETVQLP